MDNGFNKDYVGDEWVSEEWIPDELQQLIVFTGSVVYVKRI